MATINEILTAEDWREQLSAWIIKLVQEAGAAEHFRQEGAAAERNATIRYLRHAAQLKLSDDECSALLEASEDIQQGRHLTTAHPTTSPSITSS